MPELQRAEAAAIADISPDTFSAYVSRGQAPAPARYVGRTPLWSESEVRQWTESRPGKGARTTGRALARAAERSAAKTPKKSSKKK